MNMTEALNKVLSGEELSRGETKDILVGITHGELSGEQIAALVTAIQMRGTGVEELLGLRDAVYETGVSVDIDCDRFIDIVGTCVLHGSCMVLVL